ncbi:hypothetical protein LCGC14_1940590, partial [marine sediment metagenome]
PVVFSDIIGLTLSSDFIASGGQLDKGVFFKADTAGAYTCVTYAQYLDNGGDIAVSDAEKLAAIVEAVSESDEVALLVAAHQWCDTPIVRIESSGAPSTALNLGIY